MKRSRAEVLKTLGKNARQGGTKAVTAFALALSVLTGACSEGTDRFAGDTYRLPWPNNEGEMALRDVQVGTLSDPENFEGSVAKILIEPSESSGQLVGEKPRGRYIRSGAGVIIPSNFLTLQAVTAYAHQEKLQSFDQKSGAASGLAWPLTIGLQVRVLDRGSLLNNNAIYDGKLNALLVVPYSLANLPIAFNAGILAHEHFHFIFQKAVLDKLGVQQSQGCQHGIAQTEAEMPKAPEDESKGNSEAGNDPIFDNEEAIARAADEIPFQTYNSFLVRALNEGLADFWGWSYSNDLAFVGRSLPSEERIRRLDFEPGKLSDSKTIRESFVDLRRGDKIIREEYRIGRSYMMGTQYARFLREVVNALVEQGLTSEAAKDLVAKAIVKSLPDLASVVVKSYSSSYITPNVILNPIVQNLGEAKTPVCEALERFRAVEPGYEKPDVCVTGVAP